MNAYRITGTFQVGRQKQPYTQDIVGEDEEEARHKVLSMLGSRHRITRKMISIDTISTIDHKTSTDPRVLDAFNDY